MILILTCGRKIRLTHQKMFLTHLTNFYTRKMKKYLLVFVMLILGSASYAQGLSVTDDNLDMAVLSVELDGAAMASLEMKQELQLTEEQYTQIEQLNTLRYQQLQLAEETLANNPSRRTKEFRNIHLQNDRELEAVLNDTQMRQYQMMEGRFAMRFVSENEEE